MSAISFELDPRLLERCDAPRRAELEAVVEELNRSDVQMVPEGELDGQSIRSFRLVIRSPRAATLEAWGPDEGVAAGHRHISWSALRRPFADYQAIIERIAAGGFLEGVRAGLHDSKFEALDHGKRLVHNDAAETLSDILEEFAAFDESASRGLFTLLFLIRTELPPHVVRYHRAHFEV